MGPANRLTTPGVVNKKLNVPQKSTIAIALPIADNRAETGRVAMRIAAAISRVPKPRATVLALKTA